MAWSFAGGLGLNEGDRVRGYDTAPAISLQPDDLLHWAVQSAKNVDMPEPLRFETIDLARHADLCVELRRDSFVVSFGDASGFDGENGQGAADYLAWLRTLIRDFPQGAVHVRQGDEIVGQMEMRPRGDPVFGYVNLFYLIPTERGRGLGAALHRYAVDTFAAMGIQTLNLNVAPTNRSAVRFYEKHGWVNIGLRAGQPDVSVMEWRGA